MSQDDDRVDELEDLLTQADEDVADLRERIKELEGRNNELELFVSNFAEVARRILNQNG
jgi:regulator of replication initiation timing